MADSLQRGLRWAVRRAIRLALGPAITASLAAIVWPALAAEATPPPAAIAAAPVCCASEIQQARSIAAAMRQELAIPGLAVAVGRGDQLLWSEGFGFADLELGVPASPRQRFRLASVSKLVTAAIAARLVDQGRLDLDAPTRAFLPEYPEAGAAITPRQILGQLSGIRHYQPKDEIDDWDGRHFDTVRESLVAFEHDPLLSPPGEEAHYSTYAFTLLAAILEVAGGAPFPELVEREVARPLGLLSLTTDRRDLVREGRVAFYDREDEAPVTLAAVENARPIDPSYKWAGGGLLANAEDLVRFGAAHLAPGFLSPSTRELVFTAQRTRSGEATDVGLTWRLATDPDGRRMFHHSGSQEGSRAFLLLYPDERLVVAFLSNLGGVPARPLDRARAIAAPFLAPLPLSSATPHAAPGH